MPADPTIHAAPGVQTTTPTGAQFSAKWVLSGPDGSRAVFNDPSDPDYVGVATEITGLDSPEVRESAEDLSQMDGGAHGDFYYGRRPITITGIIINPATTTDRNVRETKLRRASNAMRGDATLSWTLADGTHQYVNVRRQQPLRITGTWQKQFQLAVVAADPYIYRVSSNSAPLSGTPTNIVNSGSAPVFPTITVTPLVGKPMQGVEVANLTTGKVLRVEKPLEVGETLTLDTAARQARIGNTSVYSFFDFIDSEWWPLEPGENSIQVRQQNLLDPELIDWVNATTIGAGINWDIVPTVTVSNGEPTLTAKWSEAGVGFGTIAFGRNASTSPGDDSWITVSPGSTYTMSADYTVEGLYGSRVELKAFTALSGSPSAHHTPGVVSHDTDGRYRIHHTFSVPASHTRMTVTLGVASGANVDNEGKVSITAHGVTLQPAEASGSINWRDAWI